MLFVILYKICFPLSVKLSTGYKYKFVISIGSVLYTRYLKKHKFVTRIIIHINVLYEFMKFGYMFLLYVYYDSV